MAVSSTSSSTVKQAPKSENTQAPKNEPRKPQDNTAARQSPQETRAAVENTFGKVPDNGTKNGAAKKPDANAPSQPKNGAATPPANDQKAAPADTKLPAAANKTNTPITVKTPLGNPATPKTSNLATGDAKTSQTTDARTPVLPVAPNVQSIFGSTLSEGKTVKEKLDAEAPAYIAKAAQDHYNAQKDKGEALDNISKFYLNSTAKVMAENGVPEQKIKPEQLADVFDPAKIGRNLDELSRSPEFIKWVAEQQANAVENTIANTPGIATLVEPYKQEGENYVNALRRMQSDYIGSQDFADAVATAKTNEEGRTLVTEGMKTLSALGLGEKEMLGVTNTLSENIRSKYTPDGPRVMIDPNTNKPIQTDAGGNLAQLPDGTYVGLGKDGKAVADAQGNPWVYQQDGYPRVDANNAFVQYAPKANATFASYGGMKYMVGPDGKGRFDAQGNALVIDNEGGVPVSLLADGKIAVDAQGNKAVINPDTGKQVVDPGTGNKVVIDAKTKGIVQADAAGKVVVGANGDPYAVDQKTGKFVQDAQGRYIQISKVNAAPGIVPGYVVDANNIKVVVSPANGKPVVDPSSGKTVIFTPDANTPALVPLDAGGKPLLAEDGKNIVYNQAGNTVVTGDGTGPNWLVDTGGNYVHDGKGHYIGVGPESGLSSPVDAKGVPVQNSNGQVPLWDPKTNALMTTADGSHQIVLDKTGNLLQNDAEGKTIVEEKTGLPVLIDPRTKSVAVNPDTGRWIMLDNSGAAVEYNADDGYKYLIDPKTNTAVKTPEGVPVTIDDKAGMPVAVNADGSVVKNPDTGNTIVYNIDGKPATDKTSGIRIEITPDGKARIIDPQTRAPIGSLNEATGGVQLYNKDGSEQTDPNNGNKVQRDPNGHRAEVDPKTGTFAVDAYGNTLILGPDNTPLKTPAGNAVVADKQTGAPVSVDANGKVELDPGSGLPRFIHTGTGKALTDPTSGAEVVVDPKTGAPVQVDRRTGAPVIDPESGLNIVANSKTGEQAKGPNGEPVVVLPTAKVPVFFNKQNNTLTLADPETGKAVTNPKTGAERIIDPQYGVPIEVAKSKDGSYIVVDSNGNPRTDGLGGMLYLDKETGQVINKRPDGTAVNAATQEKPEPVNLKELAVSLPAGVAKAAMPDGAPAIAIPVENSATQDMPTPVDTSKAPGNPAPGNAPGVPPQRTEPWLSPDYVTSIEEQNNFIEWYKKRYDVLKEKINPKLLPYDVEAAAIEKIKSLPGNEALKNIPTPDLVALRIYSREHFPAVVNNVLDQLMGTKPATDYELFIKSIQSALNRLGNNGYAYEGPALRIKPMLLDAYRDLVRDGNYFRNYGFMRASAAPDLTFTGNVKIKFDKIKGVSISAVSAEPEKFKTIVMQPNQLNAIENIDYWTPNVRPHDYDEMPGRQINMNSIDEPLLKNDPAPAGTSAPYGDPDEILPDPLPGKNTPVPSTATDTSPPAAPLPTLEQSPAAKAASARWSAVGKALGYAAEGLGIVAGGVQSVAGGFQIDEGIKNNNPYDIAAGAFNVTSGALGIGTSAAVLAGGAAAAAALPLAGAAAVFGMVALIIDIVKHKDDHNKFADNLGSMYDPLGILKEGWHEKAAKAYYDSQGEPDPAPIAHGNNP